MGFTIENYFSLYVIDDWQGYSPSSGEYTHQLLERLERRSNVELDVILLDICHVRSERRVVVRIIPLPRWSLNSRSQLKRIIEIWIVEYIPLGSSNGEPKRDLPGKT
jgi:hypothetical protein